MNTILITGATGLLAPYLAETMQSMGRVVTTSRSGGDVSCDLTDTLAVQQLFQNLRPNIVIHTAALTDVDRCEAEPEEAKRLNHVACETLAALSSEHKARLVYISTDQVYSGRHKDNSETDQPAPVNVYGSSKLAGEQAVMSNGRNLVFRTNMFGPSRTPGRMSLSDFFFAKLKRQEPLMLFADMYFSPLHMQTLSDYVAQSIRKEIHGTYNLGSRCGLSKKDFCIAIARLFGFDTANTRAASGLDNSDRAPRPADLRLNVERIEKALGVQMPTLIDEIEKLTEQASQ
ncbi:SDR family oxidoreductase [Magnetovibrio sp.]|uniref:SDR family oxidoreductase n=1 Tax=Magnetovibrio sp. TaxID=2024836 RepID=UPI002F954443